jgi:alpha-beta hydrolase superfamily lysophospholipase
VPEAVTIDSNLIVYSRPYSPAPTAHAFASVVLLSGGNGVLNLTAAGDIRESSGNFLIRSARRFLDLGLNVAMLDAEPAFPGPSGLTNQRHTMAHAAHLANVIDKVRKRWPGKAAWLVGTSNGTISTVNAAAHLSHKPDGIILTSSVTTPDPTGEKHFVTEPGLGLGLISVPTYVVWHTNDECPFSHKSAASTVFAGLTSVPIEKKLELVVSKGLPNVAMSPCSAFGFHGFTGFEDGVVSLITKFIKTHSP